MKRIVIALAAIAVAAVATVGVARVAGDADSAPRPSTSRDPGSDVSHDFDLQQLKDQAALQSKQKKKAKAELARRVREYASKHAHDGH